MEIIMANELAWFQAVTSIKHLTLEELNMLTETIEAEKLMRDSTKRIEADREIVIKGKNMNFNREH